MKTLTIEIENETTKIKKNDSQYQQVINSIKAGGVVVFPTDTIYGIGGNPFNKNTIRKIFKIKSRLKDKGLPVLINDLNSLQNFSQITDQQKKVINKVWPGAVTLILPKKEEVPFELTGGKNSIALRIPNHPFLRDLISQVGGSLIGTSANLSSEKPFHDEKYLRNFFENKVDCIIIQKKFFASESSTIINLLEKKPKVIRQRKEKGKILD
ncbi:MAG: L-threonylcarbamoyladenylate synthase [Candidatus Ranarchaeia archaeon]